MSKPGARRQVLIALYAAEQSGSDGPSPVGLSQRARRLAEGVWSHRAELDEALARVSANWRVERMPAVDRNLLRMGLYELRYAPAMKTAVIISEAVALAKEYGTERSGGFVNGVLSRLAAEERSSPAGDIPATLPPASL